MLAREFRIPVGGEEQSTVLGGVECFASEFGQFLSFFNSREIYEARAEFDTTRFGVGNDVSKSIMKANAIKKLNDTYLPIYQRFGKPILFAEVAYYSAASSAQQTYGVYSSEISVFNPETVSVASAWREQASAIEATISAFAETNWIQGSFLFGNWYWTIDEKGYAIWGKQSEQTLTNIYNVINQAPFQ